MEKLVPNYPHLRISQTPAGKWLWQVFVEGRLARLGCTDQFMDCIRAGEHVAEQEWDKITEVYDFLNSQRLDP